MDRRTSSGVFFLPDEKFDFNVSLSSCSDEDEVFVGPVSLKERCVSLGMESHQQASFGLLTSDQLEEVCQEAHKVAHRLQRGQSARSDGDTEDFVQDGEAKLEMLDPAARVLSPLKRETFCVQDSPMRQLPPAIQRQLLRGSSTRGAASSSRLSASRPPSTRLSASRSSPREVAKPPARPALRGKASLGGAVVLPNKPSAPSASSSASKSRAERTRLPPPSKVACTSKRSPSCRYSRAQSCEDLLSDSASVASDLSDSSVGSNMSGRRALAPPTKTVGLRNVSAAKAPPRQTRRNTSSSSSSMSSFSSSTSLSPAKGKGSSTGPAPGSISRARRSTVEPPRPAAGRRSLSTQSRLPEAECVKPARPSLLKRSEVTPAQPTPSRRLTERLKVAVLPTPGTGRRAATSADDVSSVPRPKRLMSLCSFDSLPQKPSVGPLTPSAGGCSSLQLKARRPSALPTPAKRRASAIPTPRSSNAVRGASSLGSARKDCSFSPASKAVQEEPNDAPDIKPFSLDQEEEEEEEEPPAPPPPASPPQEKQAERPEVVEPEPEGSMMEVQPPEEQNDKTKEVLLPDLPSPVLQPREKLLIDLRNTPELIRTGGKTGSAAQLIDLSSPLIKWSPEEKKENTAPLINLSF